MVKPYRPENKLLAAKFYMDFAASGFTRRTVPMTFVERRRYSTPIRITGKYVNNIVDSIMTAHKGNKRHYLSHKYMIFRYAKTAALCGAKWMQLYPQVETLG